MKISFLWSATIVIMACLPLACSKSQEKSEKEHLEGAITYVKEQLDALRTGRGAWPKDKVATRFMLKRVLDMMESHGAAAITTVPEPFLVFYDQRDKTKTKSGHDTLVVFWLERNTDIAAIRVREYWSTGQEISEIYEMCPEEKSVIRHFNKSSWINNRIWEITGRTNPDVRQDYNAWTAWMSSTVASPENQPPIYISKPSREVKILISLIDEVGHESRAVQPILWVK